MKARFLYPALAVVVGLLLWLGAKAALTQEPPANPSPPAAAAPSLVPKPDLSNLERLRFHTDSDYPPFNYLDENGTLTGFNVDLAQAICDELGVECVVRAVRWEELVPALAKEQADAVIASLRIDEQTVALADFTDSYYHTPARFVTRKASPNDVITPEAVAGRRVGVVQGTAHEVFLRDFFARSTVVPFPDSDQAKASLVAGNIDLLFGDGISLMFWLNGTASNGCCEFRGGPYTESKYFGEGVGVAVKQGDRRMRDILDYGLDRVRASGRFEELLLRYFPMSVF